jgi:hypothetical protein
MRHILVKTPRELAISAADEKEWIKDKQFIMCKVPLRKLSVGCAQNISASSEIIIEVNKNKVSAQAAGFVPKIMVLAGVDQISKLKKKGAHYHDCWVSLSAAKEMGLTAADQSNGLGSSQLTTELSAILRQQSKKASSSSGVCDSGYDYSYIIEVYPDNKYFIYSKKGLLWKQSYSFIGKSQMLQFSGVPIRVKVTYSEMAAEGEVMLFGDEEVIRNYGGRTSEANTNPTRTMSNVLEALKMYNEAKTTGKWVPQVTKAMPIPKTMVHAAADALRANVVLEEDFVVMDFLRWQDKMLTNKTPIKLVDGVELQASSFAVVGKVDDPSTWNVPLHTVDRVQKAFQYAKKNVTKADAKERVFAAAAQFNLV